ncbi:MAG TPA: AI-2E family transporter [Bacteroidetes bacterium]|nr:AI-2E family transporter [Bacteroidota bacterium]HIL58387.1 AI-2E family transporter [Rhodothermales bacterium]
MATVPSDRDPRARWAPDRVGRLGTGTTLLILAGIAAIVFVAPGIAALAVVAGVLAYLLLPLVDQLERKGMGRTAAAWTVFLGLVIVLGVLTALGAPLLLEQGQALQSKWASGEIPRLLADAEADLARKLPLVEPGELGLVQSIREATEGAADEPLVLYAPAAMEAIGNAILIPFVLFALLKDGPLIRKRLLGLVPNRTFEFAMGVVYKIDAHLGGYLRGQAIVAVFVGAGTALGLWALGVEYYLVLGIVTGIANFVPYVGFVVSCALALAVSVLTTDGFGQATGVLVVFIVLQTVENAVLQPWITGKNVSLHPALVLGAILVGGKVGGVLGMALAVPAASIIKVVVVETVVNLRRFHF